MSSATRFRPLNHEVSIFAAQGSVGGLGVDVEVEVGAAAVDLHAAVRAAAVQPVGTVTDIGPLHCTGTDMVLDAAPAGTPWHLRVVTMPFTHAGGPLHLDALNGRNDPGGEAGKQRAAARLRGLQACGFVDARGRVGPYFDDALTSPAVRLEREQNDALFAYFLACLPIGHAYTAYAEVTPQRRLEIGGHLLDLIALSDSLSELSGDDVPRSTYFLVQEDQGYPFVPRVTRPAENGFIHFLRFGSCRPRGSSL